MQGVREAIEAASHKLGSQGKLAEALGVHSNTISGWKNGSRDPGTRMLVRIFELAGLSMDSTFSVPATTGDSATSELAKLRVDVSQLKQNQELIMVPLQQLIVNLLAMSNISPKVQDSIDPQPAEREAVTSPPDGRQRIAASAQEAVSALKNRLRDQSSQPRGEPLRKVSGE